MVVIFVFIQCGADGQETIRPGLEFEVHDASDVQIKDDFGKQ
jgi:hypothetical protein